MPELTLQVISLDGSPLPYELSRVFGEGGGNIGRDESSTLSLPDKHRRVSRMHATVEFFNGIPTVTNSSSSLPIAVGEQQIDYGESAKIVDGVLLEIGPYVLRANVLSATGAITVSPRNVLPNEQAPRAILAGQVAERSDFSLQELAPHATLPTNVPVGAKVFDFDNLFPSAASNPAENAAMSPVQVINDPQSNRVPPVVVTAAVPLPLEALDANVGQGKSADPFADLLSGIGAPSLPQTAANGFSNSFDRAPIGTHGISADPLASLGTAPNHSADGYATRSPSLNASPRVGLAPPLIPDDFNPFAMPSGSDRNLADPLSALIAGEPLASGVGSGHFSGNTPSIDSLFQDNPATTPFGGEGAASLLGGLSSFGVSNAELDRLIASDPLGSDPLAMLDASNGGSFAASGSRPPMRDDAVAMSAAFLPPSAVVKVAPPPDVDSVRAGIPADPFARSAAAPSLPVSASPDALTEAFLRGAALAPSALPNGLTPEIMVTIGSLLRSATAGAVDMLAARAATKREVQASVTIISVQANNPLKFLPNGDAALMQLLGKKMPGFMRADVAMRDAFDDLRAHEIGVIAGTRAALTEVLGKFDPAVLGEKLTKGSVLESLMPSARKAKLWDMYLERYLQIRREAEDDFQSIFGRAFVLAYERETARIKGDASSLGGER